MNKMRTTTEQPHTPQPPAYSDKQFLHTIRVAVALPLTLSIVTALAIMLLSAMLLDAVGSFYVWEWTRVVGAVVFVASWFLFMFRWVKLTDIERWFNVDLDGGGVGKSPSHSVRYQIDKVTEEGHIEQGYLGDFAGLATDEQLVEFAHGMLKEHKRIVYRDWTGRGKTFSRDTFPKFKKFLEDRELADKDSKKLTPMGEGLFQKILDELG